LEHDDIKQVCDWRNEILKDRIDSTQLFTGLASIGLFIILLFVAYRLDVYHTDFTNHVNETKEVNKMTIDDMMEKTVALYVDAYKTSDGIREREETDYYLKQFVHKTGPVHGNPSYWIEEYYRRTGRDEEGK
jgi:hypothetical protein